MTVLVSLALHTKPQSLPFLALYTQLGRQWLVLDSQLSFSLAKWDDFALCTLQVRLRKNWEIDSLKTREQHTWSFVWALHCRDISLCVRWRLGGATQSDTDTHTHTLVMHLDVMSSILLIVSRYSFNSPRMAYSIHHRVYCSPSEWVPTETPVPGAGRLRKKTSVKDTKEGSWECTENANGGCSTAWQRSLWLAIKMIIVIFSV